MPHLIKKDFYVWYAVGTEDVRIDQTHNQALAMAKLTDTFNSTNFSYHMKEGGRHDFNAVWEFIYNAFPFFYPPEQTPITQTYSRSSKIADVMAGPSFEGFGLGTGTVAEGWIDDAVGFWERNM